MTPSSASSAVARELVAKYGLQPAIDAIVADAPPLPEAARMLWRNAKKAAAEVPSGEAS